MFDTVSDGGRAWNYGTDEIVADGIIHGVGVALAVTGTALLLALAPFSDAGERLAHVVYCASLLVALVASAVYNLWPVSRVKWVLRRVDHAMIFGLIAGTYTPFLIRIGTTETTLMLTAIWVLSAGGMILKLSGPGRREALSTVLYIALGWSGVLTFGTLIHGLPALSVGLILAGGILYSGGAIFHHWRSLRFQNAIWHGFVLAAATCHFAAVLLALDRAS